MTCFAQPVVVYLWEEVIEVDPFSEGPADRKGTTQPQQDEYAVHLQKKGVESGVDRVRRERESTYLFGERRNKVKKNGENVRPGAALGQF